MTQNFDDILSSINSKREIKEEYRAKELNYIENFIKDNDIKEGPNTIETSYIYALYCDQYRPAMAKKTFAKYFKHFFRRYHAGPFYYYRLDTSPFKLPANYTVWKALNRSDFKYKKTKYNNIKSTPEGWMIYLDLNQGRSIFGFCPDEKQAAKMADQIAYFYYGETYPKINFKKIRPLENEELLKILQGKIFNGHKKT